MTVESRVRVVGRMKRLQKRYDVFLPRKRRPRGMLCAAASHVSNQIHGPGWFRGLRKRYLEKPLLHDHVGAKLSKASLLLPWTSSPQPQHMSGISKKLEQNRP
jgi:hypothetical protein